MTHPSQHLAVTFYIALSIRGVQAVRVERDTQAGESKASSCCGKCHRGFCSPLSGSCYATKAKNYYLSCDDCGLDLSVPAQRQGGLAPPPSSLGFETDCCSKCSGFCSPVSGTCKESKEKPYYVSCMGTREGADYELVWSDEFDDVNGNGTLNYSKWSHKIGDNPSNQELQYYTDRSDNSRVENGVLKIIGKCEEFKDSRQRTFHYTSSRLITKNFGDWGPGHRVDVRARVPVGKGVWPAIWMMPTDSSYGGWPNSGEIDIMESVGCSPGFVHGTVHTRAYNHMKNTQKGQKYPTNEDSWHTYSIDWERSHIHWYVDGVRYNTFVAETGSDKWPFDKRFYLILNVAVGGSWGGICLNKQLPSCSDQSSFGLDQIMEVDYVRVFSTDASASGGALAQMTLLSK